LVEISKLLAAADLGRYAAEVLDKNVYPEVNIISFTKMNIRDLVLHSLRCSCEVFTHSETSYVVKHIATSLCMDEHVDISGNPQKARIIVEMADKAVDFKRAERLESERKKEEEEKIERARQEKQQEEKDKREEERVEREKQRVRWEEERVEREKQRVRWEEERVKQDLSPIREERDLVQSLRRGSDRSRYSGLNEADLVQLLADALNLATYNNVQSPKPFHDRERKEYEDNYRFWKDALNGNLVEGIEVILKSFHLMQWLPSSPGRYYTSKAKRERQEAERHIVQNGRHQEYLPDGKRAMFLGGIGSVRLRSRIFNSQTVYILGASSTGSSHQGIPIMLPENEYRKVISYLRDGGCLVDLEGRLRIFPTGELLIQFDRQIPKYVIFAESIRIIQRSQRLLVSVGVTYASRNSRRGNDKSWSFCSFDPTRDDVSSAAQWLEDYAFRYSGRAEILSDFDEYYQHFGEDVTEFPVSRIVRGEIDYDKLHEYSRNYHFYVNEGAIMTQYINRGAVGAMGENARSDHNTFTQLEREKNLSEAAAEIQQLLTQLSQSEYTSERDFTDALHREIKRNPTLKARLVNALKSGGLEALKAIFNHPAFSIPAETVKGWLEAE
jgi:hypothetical protein